MRGSFRASLRTRESRRGELDSRPRARAATLSARRSAGLGLFRLLPARSLSLSLSRLHPPTRVCLRHLPIFLSLEREGGRGACVPSLSRYTSCLALAPCGPTMQPTAAAVDDSGEIMCASQPTPRVVCRALFLYTTPRRRRQISGGRICT